MRPRPVPQVPEQTAAVARAAFPKGSLAMSIRDELGGASPGAPSWLRELPAVHVLHTVLIQNYYIRTDSRGREVVKRRRGRR